MGFTPCFIVLSISGWLGNAFGMKMSIVELLVTANLGTTKLSNY